MRSLLNRDEIRLKDMSTEDASEVIITWMGWYRGATLWVKPWAGVRWRETEPEEVLNKYKVYRVIKDGEKG